MKNNFKKLLIQNSFEYANPGSAFAKTQRKRKEELSFKQKSKHFKH